MKSIEKSRFVEAFTGISEIVASPGDENFQSQIDKAAGVACLASCLMVEKTMTAVGGFDSACLTQHNVDMINSVFGPFKQDKEALAWSPIGNDHLWSSCLIRLQRYIMQCETLRIEAIKLEKYLRTSRLPLTADEAAQFFSSTADKESPIFRESAKKTGKGNFPI